MTVLPLTVRRAQAAQHTGDVPIVLVEINHADLAETVRLSSDPTEPISVDPLRYGTYHNGELYQFVFMQAGLPDDSEVSPPAAQLQFDNLSPRLVEAVRAIPSPATVRLFSVMASDPDTVIEEYTWLRTVGASYDALFVTLDLAPEDFVDEPAPAMRMTRSRFPGLHA